jgi:hypothetical protein
MPACKWMAAVLLLLGASEVCAQGKPDNQANRVSLARQTVGLSMAFMEAQRAGMKPADGDSLVPQIWAWKKPAFTSPCPTFLKTLTPAEQQKVNLPKYPSYFEAGSAFLKRVSTFYAIIKAWPEKDYRRVDSSASFVQTCEIAGKM